MSQSLELHLEIDVPPSIQNIITMRYEFIMIPEFFKKRSLRIRVATTIDSDTDVGLSLGRNP